MPEKCPVHAHEPQLYGDCSGTRPDRITTRLSSGTWLQGLSTVRKDRRGSSQPAAGAEMSAREVASTVAAVALPEVAVDPSKSNFIATGEEPRR